MVYLDDPYHYMMFVVWVNSRVAIGMGGVGIDANVVFAYAKEYKQNKIEMLEIVKIIQSKIKEKSA